MFKNHEFRVKMVKTPSQQETTTAPSIHIAPEEINKIARDNVLMIATAVGTVLLAKRVVDTVSEVALIAARAKFQ